MPYMYLKFECSTIKCHYKSQTSGFLYISSEKHYYKEGILKLTNRFFLTSSRFTGRQLPSKYSFILCKKNEDWFKKGNIDVSTAKQLILCQEKITK